MVTPFTTIEVRELAPALGAEILGVDLSKPLEAGQFDEIRHAFYRYGVIFFRPVDGHPEIAEVRKEAHQTTTIGRIWHTDHSYDDAPAMGSRLYAHATQPEFVCRFSWRKGSMAFSDNRATWHYAVNDDAGRRRLVHRITIEGVPLS